MSTFERYLTVWVALCIVAGIALGYVFPSFFQMIGSAEIASVNLPVAVLIWLMIIPMLVKIDFGSLRQVSAHWRGISVTLIVNWAIKPFTMAVLGWVFIGWLFAPLLPADQINSYIAGLILLGAAPCNDLVMVFAFAPIVALLLGISAITVPWETLMLSVALYIVVPVIIAQVLRARVLSSGGEAGLAALLARLQPLSILALLATLVVLFAFQGQAILAAPMIIVLLSVPIIIQTYLIFGIGYFANRVMGETHVIAGPSALIGASNFFELAVAVAISLFGFNSGAALATVVGVLIEVPVMLSLVALVNRSKGWYEAAPALSRRTAGRSQG